MTDEAAPAAKPKRPWPSGEDLAEYKGHERWSLRRWAWEFLRRNEDFRTRCDEVDAGDIKAQRKIAEDFGLREFKHYEERYGKGDTRTRFRVNWISYTSNANSLIKRKLDPRTLAPGQIHIRFDLESMRGDRKAIEPQLRAARKVIEHQMTLYVKMKDGPDSEIIERKPKYIYFIRHLRTLDLLLRKKSHKEIIKILYPAIAKVENLRSEGKADRPSIASSDITYQEAHQGHRAKIDEAKHFAVEGYRYLAARRREPTTKNKNSPSSNEKVTQG